jgi:hypothetical protein
LNPSTGTLSAMIGMTVRNQSESLSAFDRNDCPLSSESATQQTDQGFARDLDYKGKGLQLHFTVEDEGVFTTPWTATVTYRRPLTAFGQWPEVVCAQNAQGYGKKAAVPSASNPDF